MMTPIPPLIPRRPDDPAPLDWLRTPPPTPVVSGWDYAGVLRRGVALFVDGVVLVLLVAVVSVLVGEPTVQPVEPGDRVAWVKFTLSGWQVRGVLLGWFLYLITAEALFGRTLGKLALGISVLRDDWSPITIRAAVLRQLTHLVPIVALASTQGSLSITPAQIAVYVLGAFFARTSEDRQRLGDRLAGTVVVRRASSRQAAACLKCGTEFQPFDRFCPTCGAPVGSVDSTGALPYPYLPEPPSPRFGTRSKLALAFVAVVGTMAVIVLLAGNRRAEFDPASNPSFGPRDLTGTIIIAHPGIGSGPISCVLPAPYHHLVPGAAVVVMDAAQSVIAEGVIETSTVVDEGLCHLTYTVAQVPKAAEYQIQITGAVLPAISYEVLEQAGWIVDIELTDSREEAPGSG